MGPDCKNKYNFKESEIPSENNDQNEGENRLPLSITMTNTLYSL